MDLIFVGIYVTGFLYEIKLSQLDIRSWAFFFNLIFDLTLFLFVSILNI